MEKSLLGLTMATDPRWVNIAEKNLEEILTDHAYCEQKAASACISLIIQYPEKEGLVKALAPVVAEEWAHFERVLEKLNERGWSLGFPRNDEYVAKVNKLIKKGGSRDQQLAERLLINALIEARSCERFRLLWKGLEDETLSKFYYEVMVSEAGHYKNFLMLARRYQPEEIVTRRWNEILQGEATIMKQLAIRQDRIH